jgi:hypothetical protein
MLGTIKAFFNARKVSRWSLYFVHERDGLRYALHNDAVDILLGYISVPIKKGKRISPDWELHINFNFEHKSIRLVEAFFLQGNVSRILLDLMIFVDARTRKQLPLEASELMSLNQASQMTAAAARVENHLRDDKAGRVTLASVLSEVIH